MLRALGKTEDGLHNKINYNQQVSGSAGLVRYGNTISLLVVDYTNTQI